MTPEVADGRMAAVMHDRCVGCVGDAAQVRGVAARRDCSPQTLLEDVQPRLGLFDRSRLVAADLVRLPCGHHLPEDRVDDLIFGGGACGGSVRGCTVQVVKQLPDAALLVLQAAAHDLGGVRCQHDLDRLQQHTVLSDAVGQPWLNFQRRATEVDQKLQVCSVEMPRW